MALKDIFLLFYLTEKMNYIKELCQKPFENILNCIMQNFTYTQEKIISVSVKTLQIKLLTLSAARLFNLRSILHVKYSTLRKQSFHCY